MPAFGRNRPRQTAAQFERCALSIRVARALPEALPRAPVLLDRSPRVRAGIRPAADGQAAVRAPPAANPLPRRAPHCIRAAPSPHLRSPALIAFSPLTPPPLTHPST